MSETEEQRVLGVFAKQPIPGAVKTRLATATSPEFAAAAAEAFLRDTLDRLSMVAARRIVAFTPPEAKPYFEELVKGRFSTEPQGEGDLGARMLYFFRSHLADAERVVLVGTDSPTLPVAFIEESFDRLKAADIVLGPASDGGYYLIGCRRWVLGNLFEGIAWGSPKVLGETLSRLPSDCWMELLPPWYDVDTAQDLEMLAGHIRALERVGVHLRLKNTSQLLWP
jgi:rSAM/selenodomain-associated transferase 1